jgi:hypothetical protein
MSPPQISPHDKNGAFIAPPGREAQGTEVVGDELRVPKANGFTEGESTEH